MRVAIREERTGGFWGLARMGQNDYLLTIKGALEANASGEVPVGDVRTLIRHVQEGVGSLEKREGLKRRGVRRPGSLYLLSSHEKSSQKKTKRKKKGKARAKLMGGEAALSARDWTLSGQTEAR